MRVQRSMNDIVLFENDESFIIESVKGRQVLDSRGNPTVAAEVLTSGGGVGVAYVPAGASTGKYEAFELRDKDRKEFRGKGVSKAVKNINEIIAPELIGIDSRLQRDIDYTMINLDGTPNKSKLGANAILAVSIAVAKAAADTLGAPLFFYIGGRRARVLPTPLLNIINGGKHAGNELQIQEFMIVPGGASQFSEALRVACEVYYALKDLLKERFGAGAINVGDEGGYAPPMKTTREALEALIKAIKRAGYAPGSDVAIALDAAASNFYNEAKGVYEIDGLELSRDEMIEYYTKLVDEYPIVSIEDPLHEEDFEGFKVITKKLGSRVLIVGDDLFVTNIERLEKGVRMGAGNALIVKMNQIGTLTETIDVVDYALANNYRAIISHRSGETEDTTISDLAIALNTGLIKTGAPARGERTAKYNRLLRIEELLGSQAKYLGFKVFPRKPV